MSENSKTKKISANLREIEEIAKEFESEDREVDLDKDIEKYEKAMKLVSETRDQLKSYELKINKIREKYSAD